MNDQPEQYRRSLWWSRAQLAYHATVWVVSILTGQWIWIFLVSVFPFIANLAIRTWSACPSTVV